jgi:hypothetical protein
MISTLQRYCQEPADLIRGDEAIPTTGLLRRACPRAARSADPWVRNDDIEIIGLR